MVLVDVEEAVADEAVAEEAVADEAVAEDAVADEAVADEVVADEADEVETCSCCRSLSRSARVELSRLGCGLKMNTDGIAPFFSRFSIP